MLPLVGGLNNYLMQYQGYANPAPWAAYSQMPGVPPPGLNPVQLARWGSQTNQAWGSQAAQLPFGNLGFLGNQAQIAMSGPIAHALGMDPATFRRLPMAGMGETSAYDFHKAGVMNQMEIDMMRGQGAFAGRPMAGQFPGMGVLGPSDGLLGSMARDFLGSDLSMSARIGMATMAPFMGGSLKDRANGIYDITSGLARTGQGPGGRFNTKLTSGIGMTDVMQAMGQASAFGFQGFSVGEIENDFARSPDGSPSRMAGFERAQGLAGMVSAGRGIFGRSTSVNQVMSKYADIFGEGAIGTGGEAETRLRKVQSMAESANVDSKFVAEYVKVIRKMAETMGMSGQGAANFAINTVETSMNLRTSMGQKGLSLTDSQAGNIAGSSARLSANSGIIQIADAFQFGLGKYTAGDREKIRVGKYGSLEDIKRKFDTAKLVNSNDPDQQRQGQEAADWLQKNLTGISKALPEGARGVMTSAMAEYLATRSPEDKAAMLASSGGTSWNELLSKGNWNPLVSKGLSSSRFFRTKESLAGISHILADEKGNMGEGLEKFLGTTEGREWRQKNGLNGVSVSDIMQDLWATSRTVGGGRIMEGKRLLATVSSSKARAKIAAEQTEIMINRTLIDSMQSGPGGLLNAENLTKALKIGMGTPGGEALEKEMREAEIIREDGSVDEAKLKEWNASKTGKSTWSKLRGALGMSGESALAAALGFGAGDMTTRIVNNEKVGTYKGKSLSSKEFAALVNKESDPEKREKMIREFTMSAVGGELSTPEKREKAKKIIEAIQKEESEGGAGKDPTKDPGSRESLVKALKDSLGPVSDPLVKILGCIEEYMRNAAKMGTTDPKVGKYDPGTTTD